MLNITCYFILNSFFNYKDFDIQEINDLFSLFLTRHQTVEHSGFE